MYCIFFLLLDLAKYFTFLIFFMIKIFHPEQFLIASHKEKMHVIYKVLTLSEGSLIGIEEFL